MVKALITMLMIMALAGCVSAPKENVEFAQNPDVDQFKGVYRNAGDPKGYLSQVIWNKHDYIIGSSGQKIRHEEIELIEVLSSGDTMTVDAIKDGCVIYRQDYVTGRDFELAD